MATVSDAIANIWLVDLVPNVRSLLIQMEKSFAEIITTNTGVTRDGIGQDWKVIHPFVTGLSGKIRAVSSIEGDTVAGTAPFQYAPALANMRVYPTLAGMPMPGYVQRSLTLKQWQGVVGCPLQYLRADQLSSVLTSAVAMIMKQTATNIAQVRANVFFTPNTTYRSYGSVKSVTSGGANGQGSITFVINDNDQIRRFQPGMEIDILNNSGGAARNDITLVIQSVDPYTRTIVANGYDGGSDSFATTVDADDIIVLASSSTYGPSSLDDWIVSSGSIFGLAVASHPQLKSLIKAMGSTSLTEEKLRTYIGGFLEQFGPGLSLDSLLTTQGVLNEYISQGDDLGQYQRQGAALNYVGGFQYGPFVYDGENLQWRISALVQKGVLYGLKLKNNIKRYVPPRLPGAGSSQYMNGEIEFIGPIIGANGIWLPTTYNDGYTDWAQAPFTWCEEYAPEVPQSVKLTGLTEETALT